MIQKSIVDYNVKRSSREVMKNLLFVNSEKFNCKNDE